MTGIADETQRHASSDLIGVINDHCYRNLGVLPNLEDPSGYNDKINWLKIYDQMYEQVVCCDKLLVRAYVASRVARDCLLDVYQTFRSADDIDTTTLPDRYVLKSNHDSGSVYIVTDNKACARAKRKLRRRMRSVYGIENGEWAYSHIVPCVIAEEYMSGPIVDYKFHCCGGDVRWVQIISERATGEPKETIVDENYTSLRLHMDHKMVHNMQAPSQPESWEQMKTLAQVLSKPFRYVRVDLYQYKDRAIFGELTFWPLAGCYKTQDQPVFGSMLSFDTSFTRPIIHNPIGGRRAARHRVIRQGVVRAGRAIPGVRELINYF